LLVIYKFRGFNQVYENENNTLKKIVTDFHNKVYYESD